MDKLKKLVDGVSVFIVRAKLMIGLIYWHVCLAQAEWYETRIRANFALIATHPVNERFAALTVFLVAVTLPFEWYQINKIICRIIKCT